MELFTMDFIKEDSLEDLFFESEAIFLPECAKITGN